uniref:Ribonuclease Y n=1 Tax=Candidatus Methanophagaceae archaeon ANME-1 ERB6 TaxID=2759912 RepID=A0A7G9YS87_9EURY|nr:ribonuclease Y [Methanosarcinales archaeon ANME-1 ERB6]
MISIEKAQELVDREIANDALRKHMLAVSEIMGALADKMGIGEQEKQKWTLVGLLHDLDYERTKDIPAKHGLSAAEMLNEELPDDCLQAIKAHNTQTGFEPNSEMAKALIAADAISGLIPPTALMMPTRKLSEVTVKSLNKKFKDKSFARSVSRGSIMVCEEELGLERKEFFTLALEALQRISDELGL